MSEVEEYLSNERYSLIDSFKAMQLDDAFKDAVKDVSTWKSPIKYQLSAKVIENAIKNYKDKRKNNAEMKSAEINDNIGGFNIDAPSKYTEMIDKLEFEGDDSYGIWSSSGSYLCNCNRYICRYNGKKR